MLGMKGTDFSGRLLLVSAKSVSQKRVGGVSNDRLIDTWNGEPLKGSYFPFVFWCTWTSRALLCQIMFLKLYFVSALCALLQGDLSCAALTLFPREGRDSRWGQGRGLMCLTANGLVVEWKLRASGSYFSPENQLTTEES